MMRDPGVEPLVGLSESQGTLSVAVQLSALSEDERAMVCGAGLDPPTVPVKDGRAGLKFRVALLLAAVTVRLTGTAVFRMLPFLLLVVIIRLVE